mgnify:CR=1 FL=1
MLYFIPVLGFVFYLLLGQDMHKRKMFRIKEVEDHISKDIRQQEYRLRSRDVQELDERISGGMRIWSCIIWRPEKPC